jgi:hypothetical protein
MSLTVQDGKLVVRNGALGAGGGCCCGGGGCPPARDCGVLCCPEWLTCVNQNCCPPERVCGETCCPQGTTCVNGQCVGCSICPCYPFPASVTVSLSGWELKDAGSWRPGCGLYAAPNGKYPSRSREELDFFYPGAVANAEALLSGDFILTRYGGCMPWHTECRYRLFPPGMSLEYRIDCRGCGFLIFTVFQGGLAHPDLGGTINNTGWAGFDRCPTEDFPVNAEREILTVTTVDAEGACVGTHTVPTPVRTGPGVVASVVGSSSFDNPRGFFVGSATVTRNNT